MTMNKDESKIPKGPYCHGKMVRDPETGDMMYPEMCPYWSMNPDKPEQANGYCSFLEKGDWDFNEEANSVERKSYKKVDGKWKTIIHPPHSLEDTVMGNVGLLWDQCKECGINDEINEEDLVDGGTIEVDMPPFDEEEKE